MSKTVAITGASGHIGACLCRDLLGSGHKLRVLVNRDRRSLEGLPTETFDGDIRDEGDLFRLFSGAEIAIHLACRITLHQRDHEALAINTEGTRSVINAVKRSGVRRLIHFSSIHAVRPEPLDEILDENRPLNTDASADYDRSKAHGEAMVSAAVQEGLDAIILRPTAIIGPFDFKPSIMGSAILRYYRGQNPVNVPGGYDWVDVRDVSESTVQAMERGRRGEAYLLPGHWHDLRTLAREIHLYGGADPPLLEVPIWLARMGIPLLNISARLKGEIPIYTAMSLGSLKNSPQQISGLKALKELGHKPRPFSNSVRDTVMWFRRQGEIV